MKRIWRSLTAFALYAVFMTARIHGEADWDRCDGFSFWVKGDGSGSWAGIELIDRDDFALRDDRRDTTAELETAVRDVADDQKTGLVDIAAEFRKPGSSEQALKQEYWAWD